SAVAAFNIFTTVNNIVATCFMAMGTAAGIIIGNLLGANDKEGAVRAYKRLAIFSVVFSLFFTAFMLIIAPFYPKVYQTSDQVRQLATQFMIVGGLFIPVQAYLNVAYFTLRSGGCITVTFVFDCVFILGISVPLAYFLSRYTDIPAIYLYAVVEGASLAKSLMGFIMIRTGVWLKNLVNT
ncbi:MAG: MATE family efflux transporter, partial [Eubacteriales bacterium]